MDTLHIVSVLYRMFWNLESFVNILVQFTFYKLKRSTPNDKIYKQKLDITDAIGFHFYVLSFLCQRYHNQQLTYS